jgi:Ulp1 family protease
LREKCEDVQIGTYSTNIPVAYCDWASIRRLAPDAWFNDTLIDAVPGLMVTTVDSQTFLLSSFLYAGHLKKGDFNGANRWVKSLPRDRSRWVFAICEAAHWFVVKINWEDSSIQCYDPKPFILQSEHLGQRVKEWVNYLCLANDAQQRVWKLSELQGPRQKSGDENNCGVYVSWVLCALMQGTCVNEESVVDPLEFRKRILHFMEHAPRHSTVLIDDGTGGDLDDLIIGIIISVVRHCIGS